LINLIQPLKRIRSKELRLYQQMKEELIH